MHDQELTLDQMLDDPIVRLLMARDGVEEADLRGLAAHIRLRRSPETNDFVGVSPEPRPFRTDLQA